MKKLLFVIAILLILGFGITIYVSFCNHKNIKGDSKNSYIDNESNQPFLICPTTINLYFNETNIYLNYQVVNKDENTKVDIDVFDKTICEIKDDIIIPNQCGSTNISLSIYEENILSDSKTICINIFEPINKIDFKILLDNKEVEYLYYGKKANGEISTYNLMIKSNSKILENYNLETSSNIKNLNFIKNEENTYFYRLNIEEGVIAEFNFVCETFSQSKIYNCFKYVENIEIEFEENICCENGIYQLFIYNNEYKENACQDNIFSSSSFHILTDNNYCSNYFCSISNGDALSLSNNCLSVQNNGTCTLTITCDDGSDFSKNYFFNVSNIFITNFELNSNDITLYKNQEFQLSYEIFPVYAFTRFNFLSTSDICCVDNCGLITALCVGKNNVKVIEEYSNITKYVNVNVIDNYYYNFSIANAFLNTLQDYSISSNSLSFSNTENCIIPLSFVIKDSNNNIVTFDMSSCCEIIVISGLLTVNYEIENNSLAMSINGKGDFKVVLTNKFNETIVGVFNFYIT